MSVVVVAVLVLVVIAVMILVGGEHGPGRHATGEPGFGSDLQVAAEAEISWHG